MFIFANKKHMTKRILMFAWFIAFAICTFASRTPIYLNKCSYDNVTPGNAVKRTPAQPLCVWQEQNSVYVPQGESIYCMLSDADGIVYECTVPTNGVVVLPSDLHGQFELLIQMNDVSYKGVISL